MKPVSLYVIVFWALMTTPNSAYSQEKDCEPQADLAASIMTRRQTTQMDVFVMMKKWGTTPELKEIILDAYSIPKLIPAMESPYDIIPTKRNGTSIDEIIEQFRTRWAIKCLSSSP